MARKRKTKKVYRDNATGRLIPKKEAGRRDPSTWTAEEILLVGDAARPALPKRKADDDT